ncbi:chemotaxis protein [Brasilonema octagenarum UFV-E1]|uniref:Chemotaxis protein n=1 Tax=Brasilonema sennae CENA114 TaxID=415709 RepID=A0A856MNJ0_9CYAN|nr:GAF domain-containing protein [Brasilonema sennae]QDL10496.1 chemotaxis protein [Brasilonema sennae CENA114]QDL16842.1 chemotaxis protein [Brasilonema octagenarum UFV-E1]
MVKHNFFQQQFQHNTEKTQQLFDEKLIISWLRQISLRTKIIAFTFLIGALPFLGIGAVTYYFLNESTTKEITKNKQDKARLLENNLSHFMMRRYGDIEILSKLTFLQNRNLRRVISREQMQARLSNYLNIENSYESIAIFDIDGNLVADSAGQLIPSQKNEGYFKTVLKNNKPYISQPTATKSVETYKDNYRIYIAAPVKDKDTAETIYVVRTIIPVKALAKEVLIPQVSQDDYQLVDGSGQIFFSQTKSQTNFYPKEEIPNLKQLYTEKKIKTQIFFDKKNNVEKLVTNAPLQKVEGLPDLNWTLILSQDTATAFATERQLLLTLAGTLLMALLVGAIAAGIANRLIKPIKAATMAVQKLSQGNLDTRVVIKGEDELATLVSQINYMADQVQDIVQKQTAEAEQLKLLTNILLLIRSSLNPEELFNITVTEARQALKADRVVIYQFNAKEGGQVIAESADPGLPVAFEDTFEDPCIHREIIQAYKQDRVTAQGNILQADFSPEHQKLMEKLQVKANLVTPILKDNQVLGFLIAYHCQKAHVWQPYEINFLRHLALQVGLTLEHVSLFEVTQTLKDLAIHLSKTHNSQDIYNLAVQGIRKALKVERALIYKIDENLHGSVIAESVVRGWSPTLGAEIYDPCLKDYVDKYRQGRIVAIDNIYQAQLNECYLKQLEPFAVKANLVAPILVGNNLLGLLIAHQCSQPRLWQQSEIDLFEQFARIVGLALERANFLKQAEEGRQAAQKASQLQRQQKETLEMQLLTLIEHLEGGYQGDLTVRAEVTDGEIGIVADFFNSLLESLQDIVIQVKLGATQVNAAIADNSSSTGELAVKALKQAQEISSVLDAVDQMRQSIKAVAKSAKQAAVVASTAYHAAEVGSTAIDLTVENSIELRKVIEGTHTKVNRLGESLQRISRVVALINEIAIQTNLLVINSGLVINTNVEAARGDREVQSFAIIVEKISLLAAQSSEASAEIEEIVANIQLETREVVKAMELGSTQVIKGTHLVQNTKHSLNHILEVCRHIDQLVQSISDATISQVETSKDVSILMQDIAKVSEITSNSFHQVCGSLQKTVEISQQLQESVRTFKVN